MNNMNQNMCVKRKIENIYPYLSENIDFCDVCIVGGGISGLITAYYLAKAKNKVVLLEKNILGFGSSTSNLGIIDSNFTYLLKQKEMEEVKKISELYDEARLQFIKIAEEIGYTDLQMFDKVIFTNKMMQKGNVQKEASMQTNCGKRCDVQSDPLFLNTSQNIVFEDKVICIDTFKFIQKLASYLYNKLNVKIYENTELIEADPKYDNVIITTNNGFTIDASKLIFCTGNDFIKYIDNADLELYKKYVIIGKIRESLKLTNTIAINFNDEDNVIKLFQDGRIYFEGEKVKYNVKFLDENYTKSVEKDKFTKLSVCLNKILNIDEYVDVNYACSYMFGKNQDKLPYIDEMECMPNCFTNVSFGQNTVLSSIIGGQMLTNAIKGLFKKEMRFFRINRSNCN